jgi:hypothetical protein
MPGRQKTVFPVLPVAQVGEQRQLRVSGVLGKVPEQSGSYLFLDVRVSQDLADEAKNLTADNPSPGPFQRQLPIRAQPGGCVPAAVALLQRRVGGHRNSFHWG